MNDIENFIHVLKSRLSKAPVSVSEDVIEYYLEYIDDAQKEGLSDKEILLKIGSPDKIADVTFTEAIIQSTNMHPGPVNLIKTSRKVLGKGVAYATKSMFLALVSIIPILSAILFYISSIVFGIAAPVSAAFLSYSVILNTSPVVLDMFGQIGFILTIFSMCLFIAWAFWKCANGLTKTTMYLFKKMVNKTNTKNQDAGHDVKKKRPYLKALGVILSVILIIGLILSLMGGIFPKYFGLWNSQKPDYTIVNKSFQADGLTAIFINTLNSNIEVILSESDAIEIMYEQPFYFKLDSKNDDNVLFLQETSNGRLLLIKYLAIHEGMTKMTIKLPRNMQRINLYLTTRGGDVEIKSSVKYINVDTYNGDITIHTPDGNYQGKLKSTSGKIKVITEDSGAVK